MNEALKKPVVRGLLYRNCNGYAMAVVAVMTERDWCCYMGGCPADAKEQEAYNWIAENGDKLDSFADEELIGALLRGYVRPALPYRD
jgi:hypothetical protein